MLATMEGGIDIGRGMVFKLEATFFQGVDDLGTVSQRDQYVVGEVSSNEENGATFVSLYSYLSLWAPTFQLRREDW